MGKSHWRIWTTVGDHRGFSKDRTDRKVDGSLLSGAGKGQLASLDADEFWLFKPFPGRLGTTHVLRVLCDHRRIRYCLPENTAAHRCRNQFQPARTEIISMKIIFFAHPR